MRIYNAINTETVEGQEKSFFVLGSYSTKEKAMECLEKQAETDIELYDDKEVFHRSKTPLGFCLSDGYNCYEYEIYERVLDDEEED